jgi:hypothetical protein
MKKEGKMVNRFFSRFFDKSGEEIAYVRMSQLIRRDCKTLDLDLFDVLKAINFYEDKDSDNYFKRNYFLDRPDIVGFFNREGR